MIVKMSDELNTRIVEWLLGDDTGISSETMLAIFRGYEKPTGRHCFKEPFDPYDLGRCLRLVEQIPEMKEAFPKIAELVPTFKGILDNWDELAKLYEEEKNKGKYPKVYKLMRELERPIDGE